MNEQIPESLKQEAERKYPELFQQCNGGHHEMYGICDVNFYERQAYITGALSRSGGVWVKLDENNFPTRGQIVFIKRTKGDIYIGHRLNNPFSTNPDASINCHWYGNPIDNFKAEEYNGIKFHHNFSDVTVTHYKVFGDESPAADKGDAIELENLRTWKMFEPYMAVRDDLTDDEFGEYEKLRKEYLQLKDQKPKEE